MMMKNRRMPAAIAAAEAAILLRWDGSIPRGRRYEDWNGSDRVDYCPEKNERRDDLLKGHHLGLIFSERRGSRACGAGRVEPIVS